MSLRTRLAALQRAIGAETESMAWIRYGAEGPAVTAHTGPTVTCYTLAVPRDDALALPDGMIAILKDARTAATSIDAAGWPWGCPAEDLKIVLANNPFVHSPDETDALRAALWGLLDEDQQAIVAESRRVLLVSVHP
jgi:hypothetical protein